MPLANDNHGKSKLMRALLEHAERRRLKKPRKGVKRLRTPWGRAVDALVFIRSYQESLAGWYGSVIGSLDAEDKDWRDRDLIIMPSHLKSADCSQMIQAAHEGGFDAISVSVQLEVDDIRKSKDCFTELWDERWTVRNPTSDDWEGQVNALGSDLWVWVAAALTRQ